MSLNGLIIIVAVSIAYHIGAFKKIKSCLDLVTFFSKMDGKVVSSWTKEMETFDTTPKQMKDFSFAKKVKIGRGGSRGCFSREKRRIICCSETN